MVVTDFMWPAKAMNKESIRTEPDACATFPSTFQVPVPNRSSVSLSRILFKHTNLQTACTGRDALETLPPRKVKAASSYNVCNSLIFEAQCGDESSSYTTIRILLGSANHHADSQLDSHAFLSQGAAEKGAPGRGGTAKVRFDGPERPGRAAGGAPGALLVLRWGVA
jgi:hypothetical protein